jgi:arabinose-5-phosphate isomerase
MAMAETSIHTFHHVLEAASGSIQNAIHRNDGVIQQVLKTLGNNKGKIIISGIGKSSIIAQKLAATFSSTGSPAVFLHAGEAFHGDLGICSEGDVAIVISKSGSTHELVKILPILKSFGMQIIGILGNMNSPLADSCDFVLDASVEKEADEHNIVPTTSTTLAITIGDALAICLRESKGFSQSDFAKFHPGGQLGKNLLTKVGDHLHKIENIALAHTYTPLKEVIVSMTEKPLGAACVVNDHHELLGIITDGDIRRFFVHHDDIRKVTAADIMTINPIQISSLDSIMQAIDLMEDRMSKISVLPVVDEGSLKGIIRIHDVY